MEATRDLDVNDVILEDDAAVLGPDHDTVPVCLECLSREGRRKEIGNNYAIYSPSKGEQCANFPSTRNCKDVIFILKCVPVPSNSTHVC